MDQAKIRARFEVVCLKAETEWGALRRFISARPLAGFWLGAALGAAAGAFIIWVWP